MPTSSRKGTSNSRRVAALVAAFGLVFASCSNSGDGDAEPAPTAAAVTPEVTDPPPPTDAADVTVAPDITDATTQETTPVATDPPEQTPDIGTFEPISGVPGVTDETINFTVTGTGAANPLGYCLLDCYAGGVQAYFDYQNSLGGVNGRDLTISIVDDEWTNAQVKTLEIIDDPNSFGVFAAPFDASGIPDLGKSGVPFYTTAPNALQVNGLENGFIPVGTMCALCPAPMTVWGAKLFGGTKVAALGLGVAQASKDCVDRNETELAEWGAAAGVEMVYKNSDLAFGLPNGIGPEVTAMKDLGVNYITTCVDQNTALVLIQELERQGMSDVTVILPQGYGDTDFITNNADVLEGNVLGVAFRPVEAGVGDSMLQTMIDWMNKGGYQINDYTVQGWLGADLAVSGLLAAGPQFDQASMVAASNTLTEFTAGGLVPTVDWSTAHTAREPDGPGRVCQAYVKVVSGALELVGDPEKPWYCYDELPLVEWQDATQMSFG